MKTTTSFLFFALILIANFAVLKSFRLKSKLVSGEPLILHEMPYLASIRLYKPCPIFKYVHVCNGFLVSPGLIATAGECMLVIKFGDTDLTYYQVRLNTNITSLEDCELYKIIDAKHYSEYNHEAKNTEYNIDVGILLVTRLSGMTRFIGLPLCDSFINFNQEGYIYGWEWSQHEPELIQMYSAKMKIKIKSEVMCYHMLRGYKFNHETQMCGSPKVVGQLSTVHDIGSPVLGKTTNSIIGIVIHVPDFIGGAIVLSRVDKLTGFIEYGKDLIRNIAASNQLIL